MTNKEFETVDVVTARLISELSPGARLELTELLDARRIAPVRHHPMFPTDPNRYFYRGLYDLKSARTMDLRLSPKRITSRIILADDVIWWHHTLRIKLPLPHTVVNAMRGLKPKLVDVVDHPLLDDLVVSSGRVEDREIVIETKRLPSVGIRELLGPIAAGCTA